MKFEELDYSYRESCLLISKQLSDRMNKRSLWEKRRVLANQDVDSTSIAVLKSLRFFCRLLDVLSSDKPEDVLEINIAEHDFLEDHLYQWFIIDKDMENLRDLCHVETMDDLRHVMNECFCEWPFDGFGSLEMDTILFNYIDIN